MNPIICDPTRRHDFLMLFEVADGNPNGDPDAGNMPRIDPETGHGLVTDVCLKRKVRNFVSLDKEGLENYGIFIHEKGILNRQIEQAYTDLKIDLQAEPTEKADGKRKTKGKGQGSEVDSARNRLCATKYDIRMFGAVMSTGANGGQVRGPMQLTFGRSVDPIASMEVSITRMAVATEAEAENQGGDNRTMGRKAILPYALYVAKGFFNPAFAKQTGVTSDDLAVFWRALEMMWDVDRSAARGMMGCRGVYVFTHESSLGNAPAHKLFDRLHIEKRPGVVSPRSFADYSVALNTANLPVGVELTLLQEG
nr:type I-C CRISPR-associated protein Cas7/Csd2 [Armatimonas sp.]